MYDGKPCQKSYHVFFVIGLNKHVVLWNYVGVLIFSGLQRPASVSAFPVQADTGTRRINDSENSKKDPSSKVTFLDR